MFFLWVILLVTTSKALVTSSVALAPSSDALVTINSFNKKAGFAHSQMSPCL